MSTMKDCSVNDEKTLIIQAENSLKDVFVNSSKLARMENVDQCQLKVNGLTVYFLPTDTPERIEEKYLELMENEKDGLRMLLDKMKRSIYPK